MHDNGEGFRQDHAKAFEYFQLAKNQGNALAQYNLGYMYENGEGCKQDYKQAIECYQLASNQGDKDAQASLENLQKLLSDKGQHSRPVLVSTASTDIEKSQPVSIEGLEAVKFKGVIRLVEGYQPPLSCHEHMLQDLPFVLPNVKAISMIVEDCVMVAESCLEHLPPGIPKLSTNKALAIAAYSYDLGFNCNGPSKNLFTELNNVLRERNSDKMQKLKPFLAYLLAGLTELPPVEDTVFRGVPISAMEVVQKHYLEGISIHWSAFTSTTTNIKKAKSFARAGGIIFRIKIKTGRNIKHYSAISEEDEVLLSPNCGLFVSCALHMESDGFNYVDMVEKLSGTFVF